MLTLNSSLLNLLAAFCQILKTELHFVDVLHQIRLMFKGIFLVKFKLKVNGVIFVSPTEIRNAYKSFEND